MPTTRSAAAAAPSIGPFQYGHVWWSSDRAELAPDRFEGRAYQLGLMATVALLSAGQLVMSSSSGQLVWATPEEFALSPSGLPLSYLVGIRAASAALVWGVAAVKLALPLGEGGVHTFETLDRRDIPFYDVGVWRFQGFTTWSWFLLGFYFAGAFAVHGMGLLEQAIGSAHAAVDAIRRDAAGVGMAAAGGA